MRFIALAPGIHTLDTLVLTDIESGASKFLRYDILSGYYQQGFPHDDFPF